MRILQCFRENRDMSKFITGFASKLRRNIIEYHQSADEATYFILTRYSVLFDRFHTVNCLASILLSLTLMHSALFFVQLSEIFVKGQVV